MFLLGMAPPFMCCKVQVATAGADKEGSPSPLCFSSWDHLQGPVGSNLEVSPRAKVTCIPRERHAQKLHKVPLGRLHEHQLKIQ